METYGISNAVAITGLLLGFLAILGGCASAAYEYRKGLILSGVTAGIGMIFIIAAIWLPIWGL